MSTLDTLQAEGWFVERGLLDRDFIDLLSSATEKLERLAATFTQDTVWRGMRFEVQSASGRKGEPAISPGALRKISCPSKGHAAFARLRDDLRLRAVLERAGLDAPTCLVDHVNLKPARVGTGFPFHQDLQFLIGRTQGRIEQHGGLNVVIALDRADADNGGFEVLGRTHLGPLVDFPYDLAQMNEGLFDETHRTLVAMNPGDAIFFHPRLAHGSGANRSMAPRRLVTLWFASSPARAVAPFAYAPPS